MDISQWVAGQPSETQWISEPAAMIPNTATPKGGLHFGHRSCNTL